MAAPTEEYRGIAAVPSEILRYIFGFLDPISLSKVPIVCKSWNTESKTVIGCAASCSMHKNSPMPSSPCGCPRSCPHKRWCPFSAIFRKSAEWVEWDTILSVLELENFIPLFDKDFIQKIIKKIEWATHRRALLLPWKQRLDDNYSRISPKQTLKIESPSDAWKLYPFVVSSKQEFVQDCFFFQGDRFFPFRDVIDEPDDLEEGPDDAPGAPWEFEDEIQWLEWHLSLE